MNKPKSHACVPSTLPTEASPQLLRIAPFKAIVCQMPGLCVSSPHSPLSILTGLSLQFAFFLVQKNLVALLHARQRKPVAKEITIFQALLKAPWMN